MAFSIEGKDRMPAVDSFDYVIVGGGTAAGILAYRLGEAGFSVCVLEAGPPDRNPYIHIPAGFSKTLFNPDITWQLQTDPDPATGNRSIALAQGKTLGGSSSINGMIYNRGQAEDFDAWARAGNLGWSYQEVLPFFRKTERRVHTSLDANYRGLRGRLTVTTTTWPNNVEYEVIRAAENLGFALNDDYNGASQEGVGFYQSTISRGWRQSTSVSFLRPAKRRFDVDVRTRCLATRISFENRRASGVYYRPDGAGDTQLVRAQREVIVAAGAVNSPKLLQLSGIGPAALLKDHGIEVLKSLPGVGENLRDHFGPRMVVRAKRGIDSINLHTRGVPLAIQVVRWLLRLPSILTVSPARVHIFGRSEHSNGRPDYTLMFAPASFKAGLVGVLDDFPGMTFGAWPMRPRSSGYVRIASGAANEAPRVNPRYLSDEMDMRVVLHALKSARLLMATEPLASLVEQEIFPGSAVQSDDELIDFARLSGATSFHLVGTCKMGPEDDRSAVVDPRLRVYGFEGLRVIDASIMPMIPSANTYASTMMIAEKGAAMIIEDAA